MNWNVFVLRRLCGSAIWPRCISEARIKSQPVAEFSTWKYDDDDDDDGDYDGDETDDGGRIGVGDDGDLEEIVDESVVGCGGGDNDDDDNDNDGDDDDNNDDL